jgi:hypothetical protein
MLKVFHCFICDINSSADITTRAVGFRFVYALSSKRDGNLGQTYSLKRQGYRREAIVSLEYYRKTLLNPPGDPRTHPPARRSYHHVTLHDGRSRCNGHDAANGDDHIRRRRR